MNTKCIFILLSIFFKQWNIEEIIILKKEIKNYFSSYINIFFLAYGIFSFYFIYLIFLIFFINCGTYTECYINNLPVLLFLFIIISFPIQILIINPFIKTFIFNIYNLIYFSFFSKIKNE
jgi:hypothetical protein